MPKLYAIYFRPLAESGSLTQQKSVPLLHSISAANPLAKGRAKTVAIVLLKEVPWTIPRGPARESLRKLGRINDIPFRRCLSEGEVKELVFTWFRKFQYLQGNSGSC